MEQREKWTKQKRYRYKRKLRGLCMDCTIVCKTVRCERHLAIQRERQRKYRKAEAE